MWSFIFQWCFTFTIMYSYIQIFLYSYTLTTSKYSMHRFEALAYGDFSNIRCNWWLLNHSYITWYTSLLYFFFLCSQTNVVFAFPSVWPRAVPLLNRPHFSDKLYMQVRFIYSFCSHSYRTTYISSLQWSGNIGLHACINISWFPKCSEFMFLELPSHSLFFVCY